MDLFQIVIALLGSFLAGVINTLAGNGSAITLSILTEVIGLPANVANGTNRVGIMFQSMAGAFAFRRNKKLDLDRSKTIIASTFLGALLGAYVATQVTNEQFTFVFKFLMLVTLVVILVNPKRWLSSSNKSFQLSPWIAIPVFLSVGFYGGFIQMGMGVLFLAFTVLVGKFDIIKANALKIVCIGFYTTIVLLLFAWNGLVDWKAGGLIAIGQVLGALVSSKFATSHPLAGVVAHRVLVAVVIFAIVKVFVLPLF